MKSPQFPSVIDQMRIRGQYESSTTDTTNLAYELSIQQDQDVNRLVSDFDKGFTPVRDVGRMLTAQRKTILEAYQNGVVGSMAATDYEKLSIPVQNLHDRLVSGPQDQPIGHNFFVNAAGFLDAHLPWAKEFDELLRHRIGASIYDIAQSDDKTKDRLLAAITENSDRELTTVLAVYLAGRSLEGEKYLQQHYGKNLELAKGHVFSTTQEIAITTSLRIDMLERAARQLNRATFGSFDHLAGLVTSDNTGAAGDYLTGSLRIEVQFDGSVRSPELRSDSDAYHVLAHELHHAGSAQTQKTRRCGLMINGQGLGADEGMTEYLAQLSVGSPGIEQSTDGSLRIRPGVPYRSPVSAMLELHEQFKTGKNNHFAILFNAYHGDVRQRSQLEEALNAFYRQDVKISNHLNR